MFGEQEGHLLFISKALYELKSSGLWFNKLLAKHLMSLGFVRSKCKADIWYWKTSCGTGYEYIATYVDDLCVAVMNPIKLVDQLQSNPINFKLKDTPKIENTVYLGCQFAQDQFRVLYMDPGEYVSKMEDAYVHCFGEKPRQLVQSPLESRDHPELDVLEFLDEEDGIEIYQSLI